MAEDSRVNTPPAPSGAQTDADLLAWIEKNHATIYASRTVPRGEVVHWVAVSETRKTRKGSVGKTLREAIDKAIKEQP
jgi:hypothetical protein